MTDPPVVLLGGTVNALWVARSMARAGIAVHGVGEGVSPFLLRHSRYVSSVLAVRDPSTAHEEWLEWLSSGPAGAVLLPCGDLGVEFVALHREDLLRLGYAPTEADDQISLAMLDKSQTYALAEKIGIEVPRTLTVRSADDIADAALDFSFPCALKPVHSHRASRKVAAKAFVVHDARELEEQWRRIASLGIDAIVTEIVPGPEASYCSYYSYIDEDGSPLVHFTKRKPRQYPRGFGWGCFHETAWEPEAAEIGLRFLQGVGLRGLGFVEFKRDLRDGRLKLIECNPRLSAATELVRLAGVDLARLAYERAAGRGAPRFGPFTCGLREWYPLDDTRACLSLWRGGELSLRAWATSLAPPLHLPIFDVRDPRPSAVKAVDRARRATTRAARRLRAGHER